MDRLELTLNLVEAEGRHQLMQISQYLGGKTKPLPSGPGIWPMLTWSQYLDYDFRLSGKANSQGAENGLLG
jgi:hypothetical protein